MAIGKYLLHRPQFRCCNTHVSKLINVDTVAATDATAVADFFYGTDLTANLREYELDPPTACGPDHVGRIF